MVLLGILAGIFFGSATVEQLHFNQCEKIHFEGDTCSAERVLCLKGENKARCQP